MWKKALGVLCLVLALATVVGVTTPATAATVPAAGAVASPQAAEAAVYMETAGPYYTYAAARAAANLLEAYGFCTQVVYQYGYWWVLYW
jgi:hypothetical protein